MVASAIAQTVDVRDVPGRALQESLQEYLHDKQLLLVLDNFEQILPAAPLVSALLNECRRLKVLVTSRATLHLYDEHEFPVPPLALPILDFRFGIFDSDTAEQSKIVRLSAHAEVQNLKSKIDAVSLSEFAAIDLFCQRARAVKPDFVLTAENATTISRICIRLDGLPLAIELAAARIKLFSPAALLALLQQRLPLLTGGPHDQPARQHTLRDEIAWSYDLLSASEQMIFRQMAVFVGGFTLEAAQEICSPIPITSLINLLAQLAAKSLIMVEAEQHGADATWTRYRLLETLCEYASEQLVSNNEKDAAQRRHAAYYLQIVETAELQLRGPQAKAWLVQLDTEHNNLRTALAWALATDNAETALRLSGALGQFWCMRGYAREGKTWLTKSLSIRADEPIPGQAKAFIAAGILESVLGHNARAQVCFDQGLHLYRNVNDMRGEAFALLKSGDFFLLQNAYESAWILFQQSLVLYQGLDDKWGVSAVNISLGSLALMQSDYEQARAHFVQGLGHQRELGDYEGITKALGCLAFLGCEQNDYRQAIAYEEESLAWSRDLEDKFGIAGSLNNLGRSALYQGDLEQATIYLAESFMLAKELGYLPLMGFALANQGNVAFEQGDYAQATHNYTQSLKVCHQLNDKVGTATLFERLASVADAQKKAEQATTLLGMATSLRTMMGVPLLASDQSRYQQIIAAARVQLNEITFAALWVQGETMTLAEAIASALTLPDVPIAIPSTVAPTPLLPLPQPYPVGLTAREVEVLRLLAQRFTYPEIAAKLIISRRTVNAHVTSIYSKLGITAREGAIRFAQEHQLL